MRVRVLQRPALVHRLVERKGKIFTAKCGVVEESMDNMTGWTQEVTCDACSPIGERHERS